MNEEIEVGLLALREIELAEDDGLISLKEAISLRDITLRTLLKQAVGSVRDDELAPKIARIKTLESALKRADARLCEHGDTTVHPVRCAIHDALRQPDGS